MKNLFAQFLILYLLTIPAIALDNIPQIGDISKLAVVVDKVERSSSPVQVNWESIENNLQAHLSQAGFELIKLNQRSSNTPLMLAKITVLEIDPNERFVFTCQSRTERLMCVAGFSEFLQTSPVWESSLSLQAVSAADVNEAITAKIEEQIESFIKAHHAAMIKLRSMQDENGNPVDRFAPKEIQPRAHQASAGAESPAAAQPANNLNEQVYVGSKSSTVYHKAGCSGAARIATSNKVTFKNKQEAQQKGRRPCKICNP